MRFPLIDCLRRPDRRLGLPRLVSALASLCILIGFTPAHSQVLTQHNDNFRTGANLKEVQLNTSNVNVSQFGRLFKRPVDGQIYAQPLVASINMPALGFCDIVFVATEHDSVYAFDAYHPRLSQPYWHVSFLNPAAGVTTMTPNDVGTYDNNNEIGITGTPVIDLRSGTLYVVAATKEVSGNNVNFVQRLHALDVTTGAEKFGGPVVIAATVSGTGDGTDGNGNVAFDGLRHQNRPGLLLLNGVVYIAFASHGDNRPYHGWIFGYDAKTLKQVAVYNTTPNGGLGGIWQGGQGLGADADGNIYCLTGNGDFDADSGGFSYGDSFIKLGTRQGGLKLLDSFTPFNQQNLADWDADLGSAGTLLLPDANLAVGGGKEGRLYLVDRTNMGHFNSAGDTQVADWFWAENGGLFSSPIYWNGPNGPTIYLCGVYDSVKAYGIDTVNKKFNQTPIAQSTLQSQNFPGGVLALSAKGKQAGTGIVWAVFADGNANGGTVHGTLHAFDAVTMQELWNSGMNAARDDMGNVAKFCPPTVVAGKVFMATFSNELVVYGLGQWPATPVITPGSSQSATPITVSITDTTPNAAICYTLDGSEPSVSSRRYTKPFTLSFPANVQAKAFAPAMYDSGVASALLAVGGVGPGTGDGLWANYFNSIDLSGPSIDEIDPTVNFNWNGNAPILGIGGSNWSARWSGWVQPRYTTTYTFSTVSDDGVRLWVNGQNIIDDWTYHGPTLDSGTINLLAGQAVSIKMEYFQGGGGSMAQLLWSNLVEAMQPIPQSQLYSNHVATPIITPNGGAGYPSVSVSISDATPGATIYYTTDGTTPTSRSSVYTGPITLTKTALVKATAAKPGLFVGAVASAQFYVQPNLGTGLFGAYFNNTNLTGGITPRLDPTINFNWNGASPIAGIGGANWSARWSGTIKALASDTYTFTTVSDDGVRLWVNGQEIINDWTDHGPTADSGTIALTAGQPVSIKLEYYQGGGGSMLQLFWQGNNLLQQIVPHYVLYPGLGFGK